MLFKTITLKRIHSLFLAGILLLMAGLSNKAQATHLAAADLYLDYIGSGPNDLTYQITLVVYKACEPNNAGLSTIESVSFSSSCGSVASSSLPTFSGPDTMDQLCPDFAPDNACRVPNSPWPAFIRRVYKGTVTFPVACTDWTAKWSSCDRNYGVLNLQCQNTSPKCLYIEAVINNVAKYNNSTPRFLQDPIPYLCVNQYSSFINGSFDPDQDSMTTTSVWPLSAQGVQIPYLAPYMLANPMASSTPYTVNANTGTASFTPTVQGKFVLAFECKDYNRNNGTMLSSVRRDVQVSILDCNAAPPSIDSIPQNISGGIWNSPNPADPTDGYIISCPGEQISFTINAASNSMSNIVILSSNNTSVLPTSNFNVTNQGTSNPSAVFSWTPTYLDAGEYTIVFTAKDSTCDNDQPVLLQNYLVVFIKVIEGVDAGPDGLICAIGGQPWQLNVSGPAEAEYVWTAIDGGPALGLSDPTIPNPTAFPPHDMTYVVTAPNIPTTCKNKDTVSVKIDTSNAVEITPDEAVVCRPGYFQLTATGIGLPPLMNLMCGTSDTASCATEDTLTIGTQFAGGGTMVSTTYTPFPAVRTAKTQFLIPRSDLSAYGIRSGTIRGLAFKLGSPAVGKFNNFTISLKCTDRTELSATSGGIETGATLVYTGIGQVGTSIGWNQFTFDKPYSVDSTKSLIVEVCYSNPLLGQVSVPAQTEAVATNTSQMAVISNNNAGNNSICTNPQIATSTNYYAARPTIRFNYCPADPVPFPFTWTPGDFLSDSTSPAPLAYVPHDMTYTVTTIGRNGCIVKDTIELTVPIHHYDVTPKDTSVCWGTSFRMQATGDFKSVTWYESENFNKATSLDCDDCKEPTAMPLETTKYFAVMTDKDGCSDTMMVLATIRPLPDVTIINENSTIKYGQSIQLLVTGAYLYSWSPLASLTNPNIVNPYATPTEPTTYYVYGIGANGCRNVDSVHINIDYRDNLFVPSAFTPNGDGKNDVFRVTNITFQKLQEFRVFNRWGQEIYSTTDPKKGWDGSWKGVPQDMGSYQYLIRVAYPDGYIETYKGDVSLIR